ENDMDNIFGMDYTLNVLTYNFTNVMNVTYSGYPGNLVVPRAQSINDINFGIAISILLDTLLVGVAFIVFTVFVSKEWKLMTPAAKEEPESNPLFEPEVAPDEYVPPEYQTEIQGVKQRGREGREGRE